MHTACPNEKDKQTELFLLHRMRLVCFRTDGTLRTIEGMSLYEYGSDYEAGRLYGTTEVIRQCTEHEAPLNFFFCCFMPI